MRTQSPPSLDSHGHGLGSSSSSGSSDAVSPPSEKRGRDGGDEDVAAVRAAAATEEGEKRLRAALRALRAVAATEGDEASALPRLRCVRVGPETFVYVDAVGRRHRGAVAAAAALVGNEEVGSKVMDPRGPCKLGAAARGVKRRRALLAAYASELVRRVPTPHVVRAAALVVNVLRSTRVEMDELCHTAEMAALDLESREAMTARMVKDVLGVDAPRWAEALALGSEKAVAVVGIPSPHSFGVYFAPDADTGSDRVDVGAVFVGPGPDPNVVQVVPTTNLVAAARGVVDETDAQWRFYRMFDLLAALEDVVAVAPFL